MRSPEERACNREIASLLHDGTTFGLEGKQLSFDIKTLTRRFSYEGFGFLSITLPSLGKAITAALTGDVAFRCPSSFQKEKNGAFPLFLGSALRKVFDLCGMLLENPDYAVLRWLRTICFFAYKVERDFKESQVQSFSDAFVVVDREIGEIQVSEIDPKLRNVMRGLLYRIFRNYHYGQFRDGPGISSDVSRRCKRVGYVPPSKVRNHFGRDVYLQPTEHLELDDLYAHLNLSKGFLHEKGLQLEHTFDNRPRGWNDALSWEEIEIPNSKVIFVPKDSRGPRVISCEPANHMYAQQAVMDGMLKCIENSPLTRGLVNFKDQSINQKLTFDPSVATLDLKEASDRVSYDLVRDLFPPRLLADIEACRTPMAELPTGKKIKLSKLAPMGSALTFPTMAIIAFASSVASIYLEQGILPTRQKSVYVYGDDIIVPNENAQSAIQGLEAVGLLVNRDKSFINSRFRESCGQDTLDASTVTPIRRKKLQKGSLTRDKKGGKQISDDGYAKHTCALMNSALDLGYINLAIELEQNLSRHIKSPIPYGTKESSYVCWWVGNADIAWRMNEDRRMSNGRKLRGYVFFDGKEVIPHTDYSRLRAALKTRVCPITGDNTPSYLKIGTRKPTLMLRTLKKWWIGAYI